MPPRICGALGDLEHLRPVLGPGEFSEADTLPLGDSGGTVCADAKTRKRVRKRPPLRLKCVKGIHIYEDMDWLSRCTVSIPDISMQIVLIIYILNIQIVQACRYIYGIYNMAIYL